MTLRLASLSIFALAALALTACKEATIAHGNGGGGSTSSSSSSGNVGGNAPNACVSAGGTCVAIVPDACPSGNWGDPSPCGDGDGVGCCLPAVDPCTAAGGVCVAIVPGACDNGTWSESAVCGSGDGVGCCLPVFVCGDETCGTVGATRCIDNVMETCDYNPQTDCAPIWMKAKACGAGETCNATATACIATSYDTCSTDADCGCGCGCNGGHCACAGTSWYGSSCQNEDDCGPDCVGASCLGGTCVKPCTPGADQTCNGNPAQSSFAGHCNADLTCTCNSGYTKQPNGLCK